MEEVEKFRNLKDDVEIILEALNVHSMIIAMEELSDLSCKVGERMRGNLNRTEITGAVADVILVTDWIKQYFRLSDEEINRMCYDKHNELVELCEKRIARLKANNEQ